MKTGLFILLLGYVLSQFYRVFLAVLAPGLSVDIGVRAEDLSLSSGLWFISFAVMQLPVGWALDSFGPRRTTALLLAIGGAGGAFLFSMARGPLTIHLAMAMIGVGCAPVLMASYYIFGRSFPPLIFATLAGILLGIGSFGNIIGAWPLALAAEKFGWRATMMVLAGITLAVALAMNWFVRDPPMARKDGDGRHGSVLDLLRVRALWLIMPMLLVNYAPAAGLRGLWVGPYIAEVFDAGSDGVGKVTLLMALAMVAGNLVYGPMDRLFGTRKGVVLSGNLAGVICLFVLWMVPAASFGGSALLLAGVGFFGASYPVIVAHGRSFIPPHLMGRGVALLNLFSVGGVGILQMTSGRVYHAVTAAGNAVAAPYQALFLLFGLALLAGCLLYAFSRDHMG